MCLKRQDRGNAGTRERESRNAGPALSKFTFTSLPLFGIENPSNLIESVIVNPKFRISGGISPFKFPILITAVFSKFVLRPEMDLNSERISFNLFNESYSKIVFTVLSSA